MSDPIGRMNAALKDRYVIERELGEGGMSTVYLARDLRHDRHVALKLLKPELAAIVGAERFEREIQITAHLQHPHILPLLDSGIADERLFYVMPYVVGESLADRLDRESKLPVDEVVRLARDVLEAIEYAHAHGVIHRDIKPGNILLGERHATVADFGIAKALSEADDRSLTVPGGMLGSPNYMAPEQFLGETRAASDIYAVGAVIYEALTGTRWAAAAVGGEPSWTNVPRRFRQTLQRALQPDADHRWADARAFRRALRSDSQLSIGRVAALSGTTAVLLAAAAWGTVTLLSGNSATPPDPRSIAVLPLENLTGDMETEYFSDGITEDIIAQLSKIRDLKVISRSSTMQYRETDKSIADIGRELHVATILDGSVRQEGSRVRIVSHLIDATTDEDLWTETYDRELTDVFAIQSDVAQQIAEALQATISPQERSLIERRPTEDVEAHNLYLRGRHLWNRRTRAGLESAVDLFRRATARDSLYAPAFAGLADAYLLLGSYQYIPEREAIRAARASVERALELDNLLAEAHASRAQVLRAGRDWAGEEEAYRRAIRLNPSYSTAHQWYATLLAALGRFDESVREIQSAQALDPLSPAIGVTAGVVHYVTRDFEAALEHLDATLVLEPDYFAAHVWSIMCFIELGRTEDALRAYAKLVELRPDDPEWEYVLANIHARAGQTGRAREILPRTPRGPDELVLGAWVQASLGDRDRSFDLLRLALADDSWTMFSWFRNFLFYLDEAPLFDALKDDPRFAPLIEGANLP